MNPGLDLLLVQQGCLPMRVDRLRLRKEEHRGRNHSDGDDPEGDGDAIMWRQERLRWVVHRLRG